LPRTSLQSLVIVCNGTCNKHLTPPIDRRDNYHGQFWWKHDWTNLLGEIFCSLKFKFRLYFDVHCIHPLKLDCFHGFFSCFYMLNPLTSYFTGRILKSLLMVGIERNPERVVMVPSSNLFIEIFLMCLTSLKCVYNRSRLV
jgi:hypothetical protein